MASIYPRGRKLWARIKNEHGRWDSKPTPYYVGQEIEAREYAARAQNAADERRARGVVIGTMTVLVRKGSVPSTRAGWVYAIALIPELIPWRIKVGFSTDIAERLSSFRSVCPTARPIGAWDADPADEAVAHAALRGRIGSSEVFVARDPEDLLFTIDYVLRRPP